MVPPTSSSSSTTWTRLARGAIPPLPGPALALAPPRPRPRPRPDRVDPARPRLRTVSSTTARTYPPSADSSHGSTLTPSTTTRNDSTTPSSPAVAPAPSSSSPSSSGVVSRKLRPRDRLQFIEAAGATGGEHATQSGGAGHGTTATSRDDALVATQATDSSTSDVSSTGSTTTTADSTVDPHAYSAASSASPSSSSTSTDPTSSSPVILEPPYPGLPPLHTHPFHLPRIPFSTHRFVRTLERDAQVPRGVAEGLMELTKRLVLREEERVRDEWLSKQDLENEAYLFSAALTELRTGSQVKSRNDSITLKSLTASLQRESDSVEQKMKEDMQRLQSDIQLEMNARKEETGTELQGLEMKIMDLNSKFTILLGEVRTEIEATKWIST
ncbi:hypothetical protein JCM10212_007133, partial [Sporobolomyces blumeae]